MNFTEKLDHLMKENGLNRRTFALKCDIPYTTVCGWYDRGYEGVRMSTIRKIAETFNTGLEYWAYDEIPQTKKSPAPEGTEDKKISMERSTKALISMGLIRDGEVLSDDDLTFLNHAMELIKVWFAEKEKKHF